MQDAGAPPPPPPIESYDGALGRRIIAIHRWAVHQGLCGATAAGVFEGLCRELAAAGVPLLRGFAGVPTLHPQWAGYSYTWTREGGAVFPQQRERGADYDRDLRVSPFATMVDLARDAATDLNWPQFRRRLTGPEAKLDFPILEQLAADGATDYFAQALRFGDQDNPSNGSGIGWSFVTDRAGGFSDDDLALVRAVLPAASLAIMTDVGHRIASGLLAAYLGADAGGRVHAGAVVRGSVESIRAVLCFADIRGWTALADTLPGLVLVDLLNDVFETLIAPFRARGGEVLKFLGDGLLAIFPSTDGPASDTCRAALDAASEAIAALDRLNDTRRRAGKPTAAVDIALHIGDVMYGNVGAVDRLDFTVIGPAVNEIARLEPLCGAFGYYVLVSAEFAAAAGHPPCLRSLGHRTLRGVREPREIFALLL